MLSCYYFFTNQDVSKPMAFFRSIPNTFTRIDMKIIPVVTVKLNVAMVTCILRKSITVLRQRNSNAPNLNMMEIGDCISMFLLLFLLIQQQRCT